MSGLALSENFSIHIRIVPANPRNPQSCVVFCGEGHLLILEIRDVSGSRPS